jgi:hypothetical protein
MKCGTQAALAVGAGYLLGRRRKMKLAMIMAAGAATGGLGGLGSGLLKRGVKMLGSTEALSKVAPQLGDLTEVVRGDLIEAGKAAATAAFTNRVESLTDSLHERAETLRDPGAAADAATAGAGAAAGGATKAARTGAGEATRRVRRARPSARDEEPEDLRDEDELGDEEFDSEEPDQPADEEPMDEEPADEEPADEEPDAEEPQRAAPRRRRTTTARRRSPVVRAGR